jgi:AraC-like DNA-binding protein
MLRTILLLSPIYVTIFWSLLLHFTPSCTSNAKRFLGKFMLTCVILYLGHFLYYNQLTAILRWLDPVYQLASLLVYPMFYIYFRLLMLEHSFSWKKHGIYLAAPFIVFTIYAACVYSLPLDCFAKWVYHKGQPTDCASVELLNGLYNLIRALFIVQVVLTLIGNLIMIRKFRVKAIHFYSDFWEIRSVKIVSINIIIIICGLVSIVLSILGRAYFISELLGLTLASTTFTTALFIIGWLGMQQKVINPALAETTEKNQFISDEMAENSKLVLINKINRLFARDKTYLNSKLTIQDVAQKVGTNRTYVSSIINQNFGVNFCTFVNNYRIKELERLLKEQPDMTNQALAEASGFGSVDSMKRAVNSKTELSISDWRMIINNKQVKNDEETW